MSSGMYSKSACLLLLLLLGVKTDSEEIPTELVYCENLGPIQNGRIEYFLPGSNQRTGPSLDYELEEYPEGSVLEYNCDEGYRLVGSRSITCQASSYWDRTQPVCELDCGHSFSQTARRMIRRSNTISGDWPWVVFISLNKEDSPFICGGALLNDHTVVTTALCVSLNESLLLRFGKYHYNIQDDGDEVITRKSSRIITHPNFSYSTMDSNIALIKFKPKIRYSVRVQPICLPTRESTHRNIVPGQIGFVSGWGETETFLPPDKMKLAILPVVTNQKCLDIFNQQLVMTSNMFCAGYEDARQSLCSGDSGSPFVFYDKRYDRYTIEGLVSFGPRGQCGVGKYFLFTKIYGFVPWIIRNAH